MAMLEVRDLQVYYGMIHAIKGISFDVNQGEVIALIGANGAGKTTTLHTITGLLAPKSGSVLFEGKDITKVPAHKIVSTVQYGCCQYQQQINGCRIDSFHDSMVLS